MKYSARKTDIKKQNIHRKQAQLKVCTPEANLRVQPSRVATILLTPTDAFLNVFYRNCSSILERHELEQQTH